MKRSSTSVNGAATLIVSVTCGSSHTNTMVGVVILLVRM
jgi:hypothetical protein